MRRLSEGGERMGDGGEGMESMLRKMWKNKLGVKEGGWCRLVFVWVSRGHLGACLLVS